MNVLRKKVMKSIPLWAILALVISTGTALAAYQWMSNRIGASVTVNLPAVTISGSSQPITATKGFLTPYEMTYTVNSGSPTGYVYVQFAGSFTAREDIVVVSGSVTPTGGSEIPLYFVPNSWVMTDPYHIQCVLLGNTGGNPDKIAFGSTGGTIVLNVEYNALGGGQGIMVQLTSTPTP